MKELQTSFIAQNDDLFKEFHNFIIKEYTTHAERKRKSPLRNEVHDPVPHIQQIANGAFSDLYEEIARVISVREGIENDIDFEKTKLLYSQLFDQNLPQDEMVDQPVLKEIYKNIIKYFTLYQFFYEDFNGYQNVPVAEVW